jgi:hypothetical protein
VVDDEACKLIFVEGQAAIAYTGLANVKPPPRGQTDLWIVDVLTPPPSRLPDFTRILGSAAAERFAQISHLGPRAKRHSFVMAGWQRAGQGDAFEPFVLTLSNAENEDGTWQERATKPGRFTQRTRLLDGDFRLLSSGQPLDPGDQAAVRAQLTDAANREPAAIASILATAVRSTAAENSAVGRGLLAAVLPCPGTVAAPGVSVQTVLPSGEALITFPAVHGPTAFYIPSETNRGTLYAPHLIARGLSQTDVQVHPRALSPEEIKHRYEEGLRNRS